MDGVYEPHTNVLQCPKIAQPTHARWEQVDYSKPSDVKPTSAGTLFPPLAPAYARQFFIADTYFVTPPTSVLGVPGPDGDVPDHASVTLSAVEDDVLSELPPECLRGFKAAREQELEWKGRWREETVDGLRRAPRIRH